jgi:quinolinate synthase
MPPESITTVPISAFLGMTACAIVFNILTVIFIRQAHKYKKILEKYMNQSSGIKCHSDIMNKSSNATNTTASSQSKGKGTF